MKNEQILEKDELIPLLIKYVKVNKVIFPIERVKYLSNEEVVNGKCERCGGEVIQKEKSEWMLKITEYAQRLIDGLKDVDFLEKIKAQEINWIGRSEGAEVKELAPTLSRAGIAYGQRTIRQEWSDSSSIGSV